MLKKLLHFIKKEKLFSTDDRVLLAVSGGRDSMVMSELFRQAGFRFGIAHCNFRLRGTASDADELFVKEWAQAHKVPFHSARFQTRQYAGEHKISVQMAARQLRYEWFEQIRRENGYGFIATAHHQDDVMETMLINLVRGTGVSGMHGILPKFQSLIRPLLCFRQDEISRFQQENAVPYREDSSNQSEQYWRNKIRHRVIPVLKELNPRVTVTFSRNARHFAEAEAVLKKYVDQHRQLLVTQHEGWVLDYRELERTTAPATLLFELLKPFGFTAETVLDMLEAKEAPPGKQFFSGPKPAESRKLKAEGGSVPPAGAAKPSGGGTSAEAAAQKPGSPAYTAVKDRTSLFIYPASVRPAPDPDTLFKQETMEYHGQDIPRSPLVAYLDHDRLTFPLQVRYWQEGDTFMPLGMKGRKKLSDFFVDEKVPLHLKHRIPLVLSGDEIIWVAGYRIAEPCKVTGQTRKIHILALRNGPASFHRKAIYGA